MSELLFGIVWFALFVGFFKLIADTNTLRVQLAEATSDNEINTVAAHDATSTIDCLREEIRKQKGRAASAHTSKGLLLEKWCPFMEHPEIEESWKTDNWSFLGSPIDYIVFDWKRDTTENENLGRVVFLDVKSGRSQLSTKQRRIRDLIRNGNVEWREVRLE